MNKWIKLDDLPDNFWGEVFLASKSRGVESEIYMVSKRGIQPMFHCEYDRSWNSFRTDVDYLVMPLEYPTVADEDFK